MAIWLLSLVSTLFTISRSFFYPCTRILLLHVHDHALPLGPAPMPLRRPVLCTCPGPLFKCYLTLAQKCHDCLPLLCVMLHVCQCVWARQTHKMPHSCCKICGHTSLQSPRTAFLFPQF